MIKIFTYLNASRSARNLREELGDSCRIMRRNRERAPIKQEDDLWINWGNRSLQTYRLPSSTPHILNTAKAVAIHGDKLRFFDKYKSEEHLNLPEYTQDINEARRWQEEGFVLVARSTATGHSGRGITVVEQGEEVPDALFYTKYIKKQSEYRVHFFKDNIIDTQKKSTRNGVPPTTYRVQTHANGFIYTRNNFDLPDNVREQARIFMGLTTLDFGAIDIIYNSHSDTATILEVNTAPGLTGTTLTRYVDVIQSYSNTLKGTE